MKGAINALVGAALLAAPVLGHSAIKPPSPDKALTPNSVNTPAGCKALLSDKQWPADAVWRKAFPGVFRKLKGTEAPDYMVQAKSVKDVQNVVNFAREHNVRLTIISTGHDFHGRETGRSGLRLDLAALREPTVFANEWKCGDTLKPTTVSGKVVDEVLACKVPKLNKRTWSEGIPQRNHEFQFFEKRGDATCEETLKLHKRQTDGHSHEGMSMPSKVKDYNTITPPKAGGHAYARISAGMYNELFFDQADKSGLMTLGAQHGGVSVLGGWAQAGGHNPFVNRLGMQVDALMEIEVVTADGKFQKVSECNNPELYWALRGGGGSTFGVVTGATVKVFPTFPIVVSRFFVNSTDPGIHEATAHFLQQGAKLRDTYGMQGYFYAYENGFQSVLHMPGEFATMENAKKATEPLMAEMEKLANAKHIEPQYYQYKTYKEWYVAEMGDEEMEDMGGKFLSYYDGSDGSVPAASDAMMNPLVMLPWAIKYPAGPQKRDISAEYAPLAESAVMRSQAMARTYLDSRLLSDKMVNSVSIKELAAAVNATFPRFEGNHVRGFLYGGGEQAKVDKDAMGLNPAWRDMTYHYIINAVPGNLRHDYDITPIAKLFPEAGGYVNEAAPQDTNWKKSYWGSHYEKLEAIKKKVDPTNVFWCSPCVGADMLTYDDERICKNPKYPEDGPAPQTYPNKKTKIGIASLPGEPGIPNPMLPFIKAYMANKTIPGAMPKSNYFKIAMGEGGSAGGKFADMDPYHPGQKLSKQDEAPVTEPATAPAPKTPAESSATAPAAEAAPAAMEGMGHGGMEGMGHGGMEGMGHGGMDMGGATEPKAEAPKADEPKSGVQPESSTAAPAAEAAPAAMEGMGHGGMEGMGHDGMEGMGHGSMDMGAGAAAPATEAAAAPAAAAEATEPKAETPKVDKPKPEAKPATAPTTEPAPKPKAGGSGKPKSGNRPKSSGNRPKSGSGIFSLPKNFPKMNGGSLGALFGGGSRTNFDADGAEAPNLKYTAEDLQAAAGVVV
ncbi:Mitochondrial intermediate peptidase [Venturia nashicola]|nr:Mitochondrial intermediate peptidase [Venturia nashicola]